MTAFIFYTNFRLKVDNYLRGYFVSCKEEDDGRLAPA